MLQKKKSSKRSNGRRLVGPLGMVVRGWKHLSDGERRAISYRVAYVVDRKGRNWQLVEPDRMAALIIGGEG